MVRGINQANLFDDDEDKTRFLERLGQKVQEGRGFVYAWVLMDTHVHILFKSGESGISTFMRKLLTWYVPSTTTAATSAGDIYLRIATDPFSVMKTTISWPWFATFTLILSGRT